MVARRYRGGVTASRVGEVAARRGRAIALTVSVSLLSVALVWWSTRGSIAQLGRFDGMWFCTAIYPPSPSCYPDWHVQVSAILTGLVVVVGVGAVVAVRRARWRIAGLVLVTVVGLLAWLVAAQPTRFVPLW